MSGVDAIISLPHLPIKNTTGIMLQHMELCRWVYNQLLKAKRENPTLGRYDTQRLIVKLKKENPKLNNVYSKVLQMVNHQLWSNCQNRSRKQGGSWG